MSQLDPQYNKKLNAYLRRTDVPTREAIIETLAAIRKEQSDLKHLVQQHVIATQDAIEKMTREMAKLKSDVDKQLDVDPTTLSRAQLTRLARKLNL